MSYTSLPALSPGDPIRESYLDQLDENLDDHETRLLAVEAGGSVVLPKRFQYDLGGLEVMGITATSYTRIPGGKAIWLDADEFTGYDLTLNVSRYTEDASVSVRVALCEVGNMANVIVETATSTATSVADATASVTAPGTGIWVCLAAKMASSSAVGHVVGGHIDAVEQ